jgi:hypothetical protein
MNERYKERIDGNGGWKVEAESKLTKVGAGILF